MMRIPVDNAMLVKLHNLDSRLEFCDEQGETLGFFLPCGEREKEVRGIYKWAETMISDAEVEESLQGQGDYPLSEILEELEAKWPSR